MTPASAGACSQDRDGHAGGARPLSSLPAAPGPMAPAAVDCVCAVLTTRGAGLCLVQLCVPSRVSTRPGPQETQQVFVE